MHATRLVTVCGKCYVRGRGCTHPPGWYSTHSCQVKRMTDKRLWIHYLPQLPLRVIIKSGRKTFNGLLKRHVVYRTYKLSSPYRDTLVIERRNIKKPINQGLMRRHVPPPSCTLMDIFDGEYHPLFPPAGPRKPTALLFWSKWYISIFIPKNIHRHT